MSRNICDTLLTTNNKNEMTTLSSSVEKSSSYLEETKSLLKASPNIQLSSSGICYASSDVEPSSCSSKSMPLLTHCGSSLHAECSNQEIKNDYVDHDSVSCSSPESGFVSEHQHSPPDPSLSSPQLMDCHVADRRNFSFTTSLKNTLTPDFIQIVSVKSLAQDSLPKHNTTINYSQTCSRKRKLDGYRHIDCAKRLFLQTDGQKKVLKFDAVPSHKNETNISDIEVNVASNSKVSNPCVSFCGLPVITKRHCLVLDESTIKLFASSLLGKNHNKKFPDAETCSSSSVNMSQICTTSQSSSNNTDTAKSQVALPVNKFVCQENKETYRNDTIDSTDLHSGSTCVELKKPFKKKEQTKISATKSQPKAVASTMTSSKLDKIKRLKEILKRKEEDLQKVRKTCGFID